MAWGIQQVKAGVLDANAFSDFWLQFFVWRDYRVPVNNPRAVYGKI
jgi:hypothetical protein